MSQIDIEAKKIKGRDCPLFRLSYPNLQEPKSFQGKGEPEYSITMLISKKDPGVKLMMQKIEAALTEKFGPKAKWPKGIYIPFRDGDEEKPDQPAYAGQYFIKAKAKEDKRPMTLSSDGDKADASIFYPGCFCKASLIAYAYDYMGKRGAGFALKGIQFVRDGARLDNSDVSSEFDSVSSTDGSEDEENYEVDEAVGF